MQRFERPAVLSYPDTPALLFPLPFYNPSFSPETTPTNIMLAQILQIRRLPQQSVNLRFDEKLILGFEIPTSQLILDSTKNLHRTSILSFSCFAVVMAIWLSCQRAANGNHCAASISRAVRACCYIWALCVCSNDGGTSFGRE